MESLTSMITLKKLTGMNSAFGIWHFNDYLRVTYVSDGWLVVWDHRETPPTRHDCKSHDHRESCVLAATRLHELSTATA